MSSKQVTHNTRNVTLDLLRATAIIVIIFNHAHAIENIPVHHFYDSLYNGLINFFAIFNQGGWVAVDMFFVLSGFLVSGLLFNEYNRFQKIDVKSFLIRRGFKIYPSFIFFILSTFIFETIVHRYLHNAKPVFTDSLKDLFFLHNYLDGRWGHTWSVDVEEFFYLTIPFVLYFLAKKNALTFKSFLSIYTVLTVFGIVCRTIAIYQSPVYDFGSQYMRTHFRLDGLFFGVLISYVYNYKPAYLGFINRNKILLAIITVMLIDVNFLFKREDNLWEAPVMLAINPISFGLLLILCLNFIKQVKSKWLITIGQCSYSIYLWHFFFGDFYSRLYYHLMGNVFGFQSTSLKGMLLYLGYISIYITSSVFFGIFMSRLIEGPTLAIRDKYFPSKTRNIIVNIPD